jgi:E3 ubiquitin-protein ligase HUWE1
VADLQLLLRPAQQYSAQASVSHALNISTSRLQSLAKRWPNIRDHGLEFSDLASDKKQAQVEALPSEASEVNFSFYRRPSSEEKKTTNTTEGDVFDGQQRKPLAASVIIHLGPLAHSSKSTMDILADTIETYSVPDEEKFDLMCRIRVARALSKERHEERAKLVIIRLLAIAVFCPCHIYSRLRLAY